MCTLEDTKKKTAMQIGNTSTNENRKKNTMKQMKTNQILM